MYPFPPRNASSIQLFQGLGLIMGDNGQDDLIKVAGHDLVQLIRGQVERKRSSASRGLSSIPASARDAVAAASS
ncbi:MAG: hypothetical protein D3904_06030 [Candidatus Electrothrix sp. EH2]|nr:hypothetical protein [Candidatus Electrothrix sp. EH2]